MKAKWLHCGNKNGNSKPGGVITMTLSEIRIPTESEMHCTY
jgi:hypothetical protein